MPTGAQVIVAQLENAGVEVCFGLPGVHNLALCAFRSPLPRSTWMRMLSPLLPTTTEGPE